MRKEVIEVNVNKIRAKMLESDISVEKLAEMIGMNRATMYRKLKEDGKTLSIAEATLIAKILKFSAEDFNTIFFN